MFLSRNQNVHNGFKLAECKILQKKIKILVTVTQSITNVPKQTIQVLVVCMNEE